jgi:DNA-binding transcriptional MerR regulator
MAVAATPGFTTTVATKVTGLSKDVLHNLTRRNVITPSLRASAGRGTNALYSYGDLQRLKVVRYLRAGADVGFDVLRTAMAELSKVENSWEGQLLYTNDWQSFYLRLIDDASQLSQLVVEKPLLVSIALGPVDAELRRQLAELGLGAPPLAAQLALAS